MLGWKTFSAMPLWKRMAIGLPIAFVLFWIALSLQAWVWVKAYTYLLSEESGAEIEYADSFFDLKGGFGANDIRVTTYSDDGEDQIVYKVDRVTVQTPGIGWMLKQTLVGATDELPDHLGIVLDNPRNLADDDSTPGNYTNLPFDAMGCVATALTKTDLRTMDVPSERQVAITLSRDTDAESTLAFRLRTEGAGEVEMKARIGLQRPVKQDEWGEVVATAPLQSVQMQFTDLGYIAKRNAYCAKKHNLSAAAFLDYHMQEVARFAGGQGGAFGAGTLAQYRDFAEKGGTLLLRSAGTRKLAVVQLAAMDRMEQMRAYPMMISANGKAPANFSYGYDPAAAQAAALAAAAAPAADGAAAVPVNAVAAAPLAPLPQGTLPEPGAIVPFEHLHSLVGQHVDITTTYGSVRKGVVTLVGPLEATVQLDKEEGGLKLHMPANSITQVKFTPVEPPAAAQKVN